MQKGELPVLVGKCRDALHRGSNKKLLTAKAPAETRYHDIAQWTTKLAKLLDTHFLVLADGETRLVCMMKTREHGTVQVAIAKTGQLPPTV